MSLVDQSYLGEIKIRYLKLIKFTLTEESPNRVQLKSSHVFFFKISSLCICQREIWYPL